MIPTSPALAKSRLARAVQRGDSAEHIAELRREYYHAKARDYLAGLISAGRLSTEHCAELASILTGGDGSRAA